MIISDWVVISGLAMTSLIDIRWRKIPVKLLLFFSMMVISYRLYDQAVDGWLIAGGMGVGIIFFAVSKKTGESIGYADCWLILLLGVYQGFWGILGTLAGAMFLLAVVSLVVIVGKRMSGKWGLPFVPFLTAGYIFWMVSGI